MDRLSSLLPSALKKRGLHQVAVASTVVLAAQRWLATEFAQHASALRVRSYKDATLHIDAENPIALSELSRRTGALQEALLRQFPDCPLHAVRCQRSGSR